MKEKKGIGSNVVFLVKWESPIAAMGQPEYSRLHSDEDQSKENEHYGLNRSSYHLRLSRFPFLYILDLTLALAVAFYSSDGMCTGKYNSSTMVATLQVKYDRHVYKGTVIYVNPHQSGVS